MAGEGTKRIIDLTEAAETQSGDYIAIDSTGRGTRKLPAGFMATAEDLSEEQTARQTADATLDGKITAEAQARLDADNALGDQITALDEKTEADAALIQNPTKTVSGSLVSFTDGAAMPMVACTAEIVPKQSGTGTPSPDNVRPISGWESVNVYGRGKNLVKLPNTTSTSTGVTATITDEPKITYNGTRSGSATVANLNDFTLPSGTYILSGGENGDPCGLQVFNVTQNAAYRDSNGRGVSFTVNDGDQLRWRIFVGANATMDNVTRYPLIRVATETDPTYEPYTGTTTPVNLGRTVYGADAEIVGGVLTVTHVYQLFDNSVPCYNVATNFGTGYNRAIYDTLESTAKRDIETPILSDKFSYTNASALGLYKANINNNGVLCLGVPDTITTTAEMQAWAGQNPFAIVYELSQPQTYQLTPTEVNTLLGENNVWADSGDVEITYRRDISIVINNLESALNG